MRKSFAAMMGCAAVGALLLGACSSSKSSSTATTAAAAATTAAPTTTTEAPTTTAAPSTTAASSGSSTPTTSQTGQGITITPSTGLTDGQVVQVVATGYVAGQQYGVTECADKGNATGAGDCNLRGIKVGTADSSGTVTVSFPVAKGPFGSNNVVCSASQACLVSVAEESASPTHIATENITFAS